MEAGGQQGYMRGEQEQYQQQQQEEQESPQGNQRQQQQRQQQQQQQYQQQDPVNLAEGYRPELAPTKQGPTFSVGQGGNDEWGEGLGDELLP